MYYEKQIGYSGAAINNKQVLTVFGPDIPKPRDNENCKHALIKWKKGDTTEFVVAMNVDFRDLSWGHGCYFNKLENAEKFMHQKNEEQIQQGYDCEIKDISNHVILCDVEGEGSLTLSQENNLGLIFVGRYDNEGEKIYCSNFDEVELIKLQEFGQYLHDNSLMEEFLKPEEENPFYQQFALKAGRQEVENRFISIPNLNQEAPHIPDDQKLSVEEINAYLGKFCIVLNNNELSIEETEYKIKIVDIQEINTKRNLENLLINLYENFDKDNYIETICPNFRELSAKNSKQIEHIKEEALRVKQILDWSSHVIDSKFDKYMAEFHAKDKPPKPVRGKVTGKNRVENKTNNSTRSEKIQKNSGYKR